MSEVRDAYLRALFDVSKADPSKWATFVEAFKDYTAYEFDRMLGGASAEVLLNFGMARRMKEMREEFINIEKITDKLRRAHGTL